MKVHISARLFQPHAIALLNIAGYCDLDNDNPDNEEGYDLEDLASGVFTMLHYLHHMVDNSETEESAALWRELSNESPTSNPTYISHMTVNTLRRLADDIERATAERLAGVVVRALEEEGE